MKRPQRARAAGDGLLIQMTPLIDMGFLILSYFLFTMSFASLEGVLPSKLALGEQPSERPRQELPSAQVTVRLLQSGDRVQYFLDDWPAADFADLSARLARLPEETLVVIHAAPAVRTAPVVHTYNRCLKLGLKHVVFPFA